MGKVILVELFKNKQMRDIYDNDHAESVVQNKEDNVKECQPMHAAKSTKDDIGDSSINTPNGNTMQQLISTDICVNGIIKEFIRYSVSDALRIQLEGKVLEGKLTVGSYCKSDGQERVYQVMTMGYFGILAECEAGRATKFKLKKI